MIRLKRLFLVFFSAIAIVVLCAKCLNTEKTSKISENTYADEKTCVTCHKTISDSYLNNSHYKTSEPIPSNFDVKSYNNEVVFADNMKVAVENRKGKKYQVAYLDGREIEAKPFDIAIGSGSKSYSFVYWQNNNLYQLPLSYIENRHEWINSPGFSAATPNFNRPIRSRCLECHSSGIETVIINPGTFREEHEFKPGSLMYGINCQRCHGPAGQHVAFQQENPKEIKASYITTYKTLSRQQKIDACGVCHSGNGVDIIKTTFNFKPGDKISDYYKQDSSKSATQPDVHGNQLGLLMQSKCFLASQMTCNSCHNIHEGRKVSLAIYSQKCISCHQDVTHKPETMAKGILKTNCIDCHMPKQASKLISFETAIGKKPVPYLLRTHKIAIY